MITQHEFLSLDEAAAILRLDRKTVVTAIERGQLRARKFGRIWRIRRDALHEDQPLPDGPEAA